MLEWAKTKGYILSTRACEGEAGNGNLETLKWLTENRCEWDLKTCVEVVRNGRLAVLEWFKENGGEWNQSTPIDAIDGEKHVVM